MNRIISCWLLLLIVAAIIAGCGAGGSSTSTVNGVAAAGEIVSGNVYLKDSSVPAKELSSTINSDGSFSFDVTGLAKPFLLKSVGTAMGTQYVMYSFAEDAGTANINPMSHLVVAAAAGATDLETIYSSLSATTLQGIASKLASAREEIRTKLQPLLQTYGAAAVDPIRDRYIANHQGIDGMLDAVKIDIVNGTVTLVNKSTNGIILAAPVSNLNNGTVAISNIPVPGVPAAPTGVTATAGDGKVSISWNAVSGATSYNIYWGYSAGVTKSNGTIVTGVTAPYIHSGLTNGNVYYYVVTALNNAGESNASSEVAVTLEAGVGSWTAANNGLGSRNIFSLAIDPGNPQTLYAGTAGGVFKTVNGCQSWSAANNGLPETAVNAVAINYSNPQIVYAATGSGVYKTTDGGGSWTAITTGLPSRAFKTVVISPSNPQIIYAGEFQTTVYKTSDGGESWSATGTLPGPVTALAVDPTNPETVYVGGFGIFKSTNGGATWLSANGGLPTITVPVNALAIEPTSPQTLYAGTNDRGLYKTTSGGTVWNSVNTGLPNNVPIHSVGITPTIPQTVYAGTYGSGLHKSTNGGSSWTTAIAGMPGTIFTSLVIDQDSPETVYAGNRGFSGISVIGVYRTTTGGAP